MGTTCVRHVNNPLTVRSPAMHIPICVSCVVCRVCNEMLDVFVSSLKAKSMLALPAYTKTRPILIILSCSLSSVSLYIYIYISYWKTENSLAYTMSRVRFSIHPGMSRVLNSSECLLVKYG